MGKVIPFPDRSRASKFPHRPGGFGKGGEVENIQVTISSSGSFDIMAQCQGLIHVFGEVPGTCMCGENYWGPDAIPPPPTIGIHPVQ